MFVVSNDFSEKTATVGVQTFQHHSKKPTCSQREGKSSKLQRWELRSHFRVWKVLIALRLGRVWTKTAKSLPHQNDLHLTPPDLYQEKKKKKIQLPKHPVIFLPPIRIPRPPPKGGEGNLRIELPFTFLFSHNFKTGKKLETPYINKALSSFKILSGMRNTSHQIHIPTFRKAKHFCRGGEKRWDGVGGVE